MKKDNLNKTYIEENDYIDRKINYYKGCLLGGALGDALGYPIEFDSIAKIKQTYGERGLQRPVTDESGKALISDDTQMTLFAANGLIAGHYRGLMRGVGGDPDYHTYSALEDWLATQGCRKGNPDLPHTSWLTDVKELHALRAPGNTCLSSLQQSRMGLVAEPINDS